MAFTTGFSNAISINRLKSGNFLAAGFFNESYPDCEVVLRVTQDHAIDANDTESYPFKCRVLRPIIHPQVYYRIFLDNNSSLLFTGARKVNQGVPDATANATVTTWKEEYEFDIQFTTNMTRGQCLGMDIYSRTWRKHALPFHYVCKII